MCPTAEPTPPAADISVGEFDAGTWRKDELIALARTLGIPTKGTKADLADRIRTTLMWRSITPSIEVRTGVSAAGASLADGASATAHQRDDQSRVQTAVPDFFRETAGESRAEGLAAWFARRTVRSTPR